ncbi:MAG: hypothetical protein RLZZ264_137 [Bacillota bacterium]|jgi:RNA-binding protein
MTSKQRLYLRKLGQTLPTKYQVGKDAVHPELIQLLDLALTKNELIKVHLLKSSQTDADNFLPTLVKTLKAELVQTIGHRVIIYRPNPKNPRIQLPT